MRMRPIATIVLGCLLMFVGPAVGQQGQTTNERPNDDGELEALFQALAGESTAADQTGADFERPAEQHPTIENATDESPGASLREIYLSAYRAAQRAADGLDIEASLRSLLQRLAEHRAPFSDEQGAPTSHVEAESAESFAEPDRADWDALKRTIREEQRQTEGSDTQIKEPIRTPVGDTIHAATAAADARPEGSVVRKRPDAAERERLIVDVTEEPKKLQERLRSGVAERAEPSKVTGDQEQLDVARLWQLLDEVQQRIARIEKVLGIGGPENGEANDSSR